MVLWPRGGGCAMTDKSSDKILVLYGSQTGNAQAIAEKLNERLVQENFNVTLKVLNQYDKLSAPITEQQLVAMICSTTGSGDAPDNASRFLRYVKKRAHPKDLLCNMRLALLGLGDTNYSAFCQPSKVIHRRCVALGATMLLPLACADDATGLEDTVEPWLNNVIQCFTDLRRTAHIAGGGAVGEEKVPEQVQEKVLEQAQEKVPEQVQQKAPEHMQDKMSEQVHEKAPEYVRENGQESVEEQVLEQKHEQVQDKAPEKAQVKLPEQVPEHVQQEVPEHMQRQVQESVPERVQIGTECQQQGQQGQQSVRDYSPSRTSADEQQSVQSQQPKLFPQPPTIPFHMRISGFDAVCPRAGALIFAGAVSAGALASALEGVPTDTPSEAQEGTIVRFAESSRVSGPSSLSHCPCPDALNKLEGGAPIHSAEVVQARWLHQNSDSEHQVKEKQPQQQKQQQQQQQQQALPSKKVLELVLEVQDDPSWSYAAGDSIGIHCPNVAAEIDFILSRCCGPGAEEPDKPCLFEQQSAPHSERKPKRGRARRRGAQSFAARCPPGFTCTARQALLYMCDVRLRPEPKRALLQLLAVACSDSGERSRMLMLCCAKPGRKVVANHSNAMSVDQLGNQCYRDFIQAQQPSLAELLSVFPSCSPPLGALLDVLPPLQPRLYSISSSPLQHDKDTHTVVARPGGKREGTENGTYYRFAIAFTVLEYCLRETSLSVRREGLCTHALERLAQPFLCPTDTRPSGALVRFHKSPKPDFSFPATTGQVPVLMIATGTGVSPFVGFLQHMRIERERRTAASTVCSGFWRSGFEVELADDAEFDLDCLPPPVETQLFFGCRHRGQDWIYRDAMQQCQESGVLTRLVTAFSREQPHKVYVQHRLLENAADIYRLITQQCYIFVCGDGAKMSRDVHSTLLEILQQRGAMDAQGAEGVLKDLQLRQRYVRSIWS